MFIPTKNHTPAGLQSLAAAHPGTCLTTHQPRRWIWRWPNLILLVGGLALLAGGGARAATSVVAWGDNWQGQTDVPADLTNVLAVAGGGYHSLALKENGTVVAWGYDDYGQTDVPADLTNAVAIAAGGNHSLALMSNGKVVAWGLDFSGQATAPADLSNVVSIAAGHAHSLALKRDGTVVAWGDNADGQTKVPDGLTNVLAIAAGGDHSLALKEDGTVVAWGYNDFGQTNVPDGLTNVVAITAAGSHSLALKGDGTAVAWGSNSCGQTNVPDDLIDVVAVAAGIVHCLALKADGTVAAWDCYNYGQTNVPDGLTNVVAIAAGYQHSLALVAGNVAPVLTIAPANRRVYEGTPVTMQVMAVGHPPFAYQWQFDGADLPGATNASLVLGPTQLAHAGRYRVRVSDAEGSTNSPEAVLEVLWGRPVLLLSPADQNGYPGGTVRFQVRADGSRPLSYKWQFDGAALAGATNDTLVLINPNAGQAGRYAVVVSNAHGAITSAPAMLRLPPVVAWGDNSCGQTDVPATLTNVVAIAAGGYHSLALGADGTVFAWGNNLSRQTDVPAGLTNVVAIAAGGDHSLALVSNGRVVAWGYNGWGQTNVPADLTNVVAIAAGGNLSLALKRDGTVVGWGENYYGQATVPAGLTNVVAIAAGWIHSLALKGDGTVVAWGYNDCGQTDVPAALTNVVAIAAGDVCSLALKGDGTIVVWGNTSGGQSPAPLTNVVAIAAGSCCLALKADGTVADRDGCRWGPGDIPAGLRQVVAIAGGSQHGLALVAANAAPVITVPPASRSVLEGTPVVLQVMAVGRPPFAYQWQFNGTDLLGATNACLVLSQTQLADAGRYRVRVSNAEGSTSSREAVLQVFQGPPVLLLSPTDQTSYPGGTVRFQVRVEGSRPLSYQWLFEGAPLPGATAEELVLANLSLSQAGRYLVVVSNAWGALTSAPVVLRLPPLLAWGWYYVPNIIPAGLTNVVAIAAGWSHSLALKRDGAVVAWGYNSSGQTTVPAGLTNVVAIASGDNHSLALKGDGTVIAWGYNYYGQATVPAALTNVVAIAGGGVHSLALKADGTVIAWGANGDGRTTVPAGLTNVAAIAGGWDHSLALKGDGTVVAWGGNSYGQATVPAGLTNVVAIAAGEYFSLALKTDGTVVLWGYNCSQPPAGLTKVVAIVAGYGHCLALKADGTVVAWGDGDGEETNVPTDLAQVVAIAAGGEQSLVLLGELASCPRLVAPAHNGQEFNVSVATELGKSYRLEFKNSLADPNWTMLPPLPGDGTVRRLSDPGAGTGQRFYRVRLGQ